MCQANKFIKNFVFLVVVVLTSLLQGCMWAPGMAMADHDVVSEEPAGIDIQPTIIKLNNTLFNKAMQAHQRHEKTDVVLLPFAQPYRIGPQDIIAIAVWEHPEFSITTSSRLLFQINRAVRDQKGAFPDVELETNIPADMTGYRVEHDGTIYYPYVGDINIWGDTPQEVRKKIAKGLSRIITDPQVNVIVAQYRNQRVYVMGEVRNPGYVPITDIPLTLADAISFSGSVEPLTSDPKHIYVIRGDYREPRIYWLSSRSPDKMLLASNFVLSNRDVVFVSTAGVTRWFRVILAILPTIQSLYYLDQIELPPKWIHSDDN